MFHYFFKYLLFKPTRHLGINLLFSITFFTNLLVSAFQLLDISKCLFHPWAIWAIPRQANHSKTWTSSILLKCASSHPREKQPCQILEKSVKYFSSYTPTKTWNFTLKIRFDRYFHFWEGYSLNTTWPIFLKFSTVVSPWMWTGMQNLNNMWGGPS